MGAERGSIKGLGSLAQYKGCTEIDGNLVITIRGSGVSGASYRILQHLSFKCIHLTRTWKQQF